MTPAGEYSTDLNGGDATASTTSIDWHGVTLEANVGEWIVQLESDIAASLTSVRDAATYLSDATGVTFEILTGLGLRGQLLLRTGETSVDAIDQWLGQNDAVAWYEPNALLPTTISTPNDPKFSSTWGLHNTGQSGGTYDADIDAPEAWDISTGSSDVVVGIIDTGVDYTHPDLANNMWRNPGEIAGNGIDDDGNGFIDDVYGWDFVNGDANPMDDHGHGTHCAGTIGAVGNDGFGVAGVNWDVSIMALKFLSASGSGSTAHATQAINYATMMRNYYGVNVRVLNNSWGGGGYSSSLASAITASAYADILFVAAAGNDGTNNDVSPHYPSNYGHANVISVAATDRNDNLASFSNYGASTVDLAAPGVSIYSTLPYSISSSGYGSWSGTSMATPHVAGVAALAWSVDPSASYVDIRDALLGGVDSLGNLSGVVSTGGRLNAVQTIESLGPHVTGVQAGALGSSHAPRAFTVSFDTVIDYSTIDPSSLLINGEGADGIMLLAGQSASGFSSFSGTDVTFVFFESPVTSVGEQTVEFVGGRIRSLQGATIRSWSGSFEHVPDPMDVVAATPNGAHLTEVPTAITLTFDEAVDVSTVHPTDLSLSVGAVTGVQLVDARTVRWAIDLGSHEGAVQYELVAGSIISADGGGWTTGFAGNFTVDQPNVHVVTGTGGAIPDGGSTSFSVVVPAGFTVADLDVSVDITHPWASDLDVYLVAPDGTRVELFTDVGGSGANFTGTILDDEASTGIRNAAAPFTGRFRPEGSLSAFDGKLAAGTWRLEVTDDFPADPGTLTRWSLTFRGDPVGSSVTGSSVGVASLASSQQTAAMLTAAPPRPAQVDAVLTTQGTSAPLAYTTPATGSAVRDLAFSPAPRSLSLAVAGEDATTDASAPSRTLPSSTPAEARPEGDAATSGSEEAVVRDEARDESAQQEAPAATETRTEAEAPLPAEATAEAPGPQAAASDAETVDQPGAAEDAVLSELAAPAAGAFALPLFLLGPRRLTRRRTTAARR